MHKVYFSLGSNIGNRKRNMRDAIEQLGRRVGKVERQSALYEYEPWGYDSPNKYINAAVCCLTEFSPRQVLEITQQIERDMGRTSKTVNGEYFDRIIDIDILLFDDYKVNEPDLQIPHPLMQERQFVMEPLKEILDK
jgi:2-amino-4-hydroxy-6-hydroxymethyldihydropteridine diphosphokinase